MQNDNLTYFENRLMKEIERINSEIKELNKEKDFLSRQLSTARAERTQLHTVTRKNSLNRVLAENSVLEMLMKTDKAVSTKDLYEEALKTNYRLKDNTFRSYLHRMKKRQIIKPSKLYARYWVLPENNEII